MQPPKLFRNRCLPLIVSETVFHNFPPGYDRSQSKDALLIVLVKIMRSAFWPCFSWPIVYEGLRVEVTKFTLAPIHSYEIIC